MARTREFNPDAVLESAVNLFWLKGYNACSIADVCEDSGVARYGLYQEFGDKDVLYRAALQRYRKMVNGILQNLRTPDASFAEIVGHFEFFLTLLKQGNRRGCLACQAAIERARDDPEVAAIVRDIFDDIKSACENALRNAVAAGEVRNLPLDSLTIYLLGVQRTLVTMVRSNSTYEETETYVHCALELLKP